MDILLPCNLKEAVQKRSVTPCSLHPPCVYLACLVREQLHRILPLTTAHMPFDTWRKPFYNRPSDCCFMLCLLCRTAYAYHIRLAHPRALEWLPLATLLYDSPVRRIDLSIGFRPLWIPLFRLSLCPFQDSMYDLSPFHTDTPCEPHFQGAERSTQGHEAVFASEPTLTVYRDVARSLTGQGLLFVFRISSSNTMTNFKSIATSPQYCNYQIYVSTS